MGICGTSTLKSQSSEPNISEQKKNNLASNQTVKLFDYNQNKIVQVPVLAPANQSALFSKRQVQSPNR